MNIKVNISGKEYLYEKGTKLSEIAKDFQNQYNSMIVAAVVNNEAKELLNTVDNDCSIEFLDLTTQYGWRIFRNSLSFLFLKACYDVLKDVNVHIEHTLNKGTYCELSKPVNEKDIEIVKNRMKELVEKDIPFIRKNVTKKEALRIFGNKNKEDKIDLLLYTPKEKVSLYTCDGYTDFFYDLLVPSTGYLKMFDIFKTNDNAVLIVGPKRQNPDELVEYTPLPKLIEVYNQRKNWSKIMEVDLLGNLNKLIIKKEYCELIRTMEALHENKIAEIANKIANEHTKNKIILIAGPSSSGKTSTSKRLALQLKVNGLKPITISTDDYFINRDLSPRDEFGKPDLESIYNIDLKKFNEDLLKLLDGEEIEMPTYNFVKGIREYLGNRVKITNKQPIIIEGIHALNPLLTECIPDDIKFKIYISPLTQLNIDNHNRISTTDVRLIRRIVRDNQFRGHDARKTIDMWESVREGEKKYIFPFQELADVMFDSSLIYELAVLKKYVVPLLEDIKQNEKEYMEARRLLNILEYFMEIEEELDIPPTSILREFIGGSRIVH